jgi:hypothetical protein
MAESTRKVEMTAAQFLDLVRKSKQVGQRSRPSKAKLRQQLSDPDRQTRMRAYKFLRYRLNRGMR